MYQFIYYIKAIAAFLITNSHFDTLYPLSELSIGGSMGNVLFFLVSGFLLSSKMTDSFFTYIKRKLSRIYVSLWPISLILLVMGQIKITSVGDIFKTFFLPYNSFWFISAILLFYIIFYFIQKYCKERLFPILIISIFVYIIFYFTILDLTKWSIEGAGFFKYIFYFQVMLIGYIIKNWLFQYYAWIQKKNKLLLKFTLLFLVLYLATKILVSKSTLFNYFQFLVQLMTLSWGIACFLFIFGKEEQLQRLRTSFFGKTIYCIGASTLEIYLFNSLFIEPELFTALP